MKGLTVKKLVVLLACVLCLAFTGLVLFNAKSNVAFADDIDFTMNGGASIRIKSSYEENGMRFSARVGRSTYETWELAGAKYYMVIMPSSYAEYAPINDENSYVWDYSEVETSSGIFIIGNNHEPVKGKARVLTYGCEAVPIDADGNIAENIDDIDAYELKASVVNMKTQNNATKYIAQCFAVVNGERIFAEQAPANMRSRSILDVSIRARESGKYSEEDQLLKTYEDNYEAWYQEEHGSLPSYSYTVKTYYFSQLKNTTVYTVEGVHAVLDVAPENFTGESDDVVYLRDDIPTNCDTVSLSDGHLKGYLLADNNSVIKVTFNGKTPHTFGNVSAESLVGNVSLGTAFNGVYKVLIDSTDDIDNLHVDSETGTFSYSLDNTALFSKQTWGKDYQVNIYGEKDYLFGSIKYVTQEINTPAELNNLGTVSENVAKQTYGDVYGHWDGYFILGNDIFFDGDFTTFGSYKDWETRTGSGNNHRNSTDYGFEGVFDGNNHVIDSLRIGWVANTSTSAFISMLNKKGVIKNVAFVNGTLNNRNSYLVNVGSGTIQDVYVYMGGFGEGNTGNNDKTGIICGNYSTKDLRVIRTYLEVGHKDSANSATWILGQVWQNEGVLNDVVLVGSIGAMSIIGTGSGTANVSSFVASRQHIADNKKNFTSWVSQSNGFWDIYSDGVCIPSAMKNTFFTDTIAVNLCDFPDDKDGGPRGFINVTLPFSVNEGSTCSSIGWGIIEMKTEFGNQISLVGKKDFTGRMGKQIISVYDPVTGKIYWTKMIVATLVINDKDSLERFPTVAKAQCSEEYLWGGTFILANDIQYGNGNYNPATVGGYKVFNPFGYYNYMDALYQANGNVWPAGANAWNDTRYYGFKGVFDGNGYNIDGLYIGVRNNNYAGAFITLLHKDGVIKNLSFTHGYLDDKMGFLTVGCGGTLNDIYIHLDKQGLGNLYNRCSVITSQTYAYTAGGIKNYTFKMDRVLFHVDSFKSSDEYSTPVGEFYIPAATSHGDSPMYYVFGSGNTTTNYGDTGMRLIGDGSGSKWFASHVRDTRANLIKDYKANLTTIYQTKPGFWKMASDGGLTTRNLNGRDL